MWCRNFFSPRAHLAFIFSLPNIYVGTYLHLLWPKLHNLFRHTSSTIGDSFGTHNIVIIWPPSSTFTTSNRTSLPIIHSSSKICTHNFLASPIFPFSFEDCFTFVRWECLPNESCSFVGVLTGTPPSKFKHFHRQTLLVCSIICWPTSFGICWYCSGHWHVVTQ